MVENDGQIIMEAGDISDALDRLAGEIVDQSTNADVPALVGIHTGGVHLAARLKDIIFRKYGMDVPLGTLDITLYRDDWTRLHTQPVVRATDLPFPVEDRDVVLVDDVLYTGRTIRAALDALMDYGRPRRVQVAVLVDRGHRELPICSRFVGVQLKTKSNERVDVLLVEKDGVDRVLLEPPCK